MKKLICVLLVLVAKEAFAHGVVCEIKKSKAFVIKVEYDDGTPMDYAEVKIFSPDNKKIEHATGYTDKNGYFAFVPDKPGKWLIKIDDGMGHGVTREIAVEKKMNLEKEVVHYFPLWLRVLVGLSIIWGLMGTMFFILTRKMM